MPGVLLTVDDLNAVLQANTDQAGQGHFGAICHGGEHRLPEHGMAQGHEVKACDQHAVLPDFGAVCMTCTVQVFVGRNHGRHNPCAALPGPG